MMAERLGPDHPLRRDLAVLASKVSDTEAIVRELMQLGRPLEARIERHDVGALLTSVAAFLKPKADAQGVAVAVRAQKIQENPWLDPALLERCLLDLALNALQALPSGGHMVVGCEPFRDKVRVWVEDDGQGLGSGDRESLFEPFVSRRAGGTGLGLYNVRRICNAMGGQVGAEDNSDGPGACFNIFLENGKFPPSPRRESYSA
jgi:signal transduction histidine kinase